MIEKTKSDFLCNNASVIKAGQGEHHSSNGANVTFKVTSDMSFDQIGVYEIVLSPGVIGAEMHYHRYIDETFIVINGELTIMLEREERIVYPGDIVHVPRFTPHGFKNDSNEEVTLILLFNPGHKREGFFRGLNLLLNAETVDQDELLKLNEMYDSYPVDTSNASYG